MGPFSAPRPEWMENSNCLDADPETFFPVTQNDSFAAKLICAECPVLAKCALMAIETREQYGVWGGLTEDERKSVRRNPHRLAYFHARLAEILDRSRASRLPHRRPEVHSTTPGASRHMDYAERLTYLGVSAAAIRAWATTHGLRVPGRGKLPHTVIDAYENGHVAA